MQLANSTTKKSVHGHSNMSRFNIYGKGGSRFRDITEIKEDSENESIDRSDPFPSMSKTARM